MENIFCKNLILIHKFGEELYPVKMKNRDTGKQTFRISKSGNTKVDSIEIEDESVMISKVVHESYSVRARTLKRTVDGGRGGLYRLNGPGIKSYRIV